MKLAAIIRFELAYQLRRPWPWLAFAVLAVFAFQMTRVGIVPVTLPEEFILNSPFIIASTTVIGTVIWLLVGSMIAGEAAARDVQTAMHPLAYTLPVRRGEYLFGRFIGALLLNALVLLGPQAGSLLAAYAPGVDPAIIGPFRPLAYLAAYGLIALPNAFAATAVQFAAAMAAGRTMAAYVGSLALLVLAYPVTMILTFPLGRPDLGRLTDPLGVITIMNEMMLEWTTVEKNVRMLSLDGPVLLNRLTWIGIALLLLAVLYRRFRFAHRVPGGRWSRIARWMRRPRLTTPVADGGRAAPIAVPQAARSFGPGMRLRQLAAIARLSFRMLARSPAGLFLLLALPAALVLVVPLQLEHWNVPLVPRTDLLLSRFYTASLTTISNWIIIPLAIIYLAGELVWRERDARVHEATDATAVPDAVILAGKFLGLALLLAAVMVALSLSAMAVQLLMGHDDVQPGLHLRVMLGLQLAEYLLFAMLAFVIQVIAHQKYLGMLLAVVAYALMLLAPIVGAEHHLLVFGSSPAWSYTAMRGFGPSVWPWLWLKLYWAGWALLLAVGARLLWPRGEDLAVRQRLHAARRRLTTAPAGIALLAVSLIASLGGFVFYNTNVLHDYRSSSEHVTRAAEYERRYARFADVPQPRIAHTALRVEIHPARGAATIRGSYRLVNHHAVAIDSLHLARVGLTETRLRFRRPAMAVVTDDTLGHAIYRLHEPLQPGDSIVLEFDVAIRRRGFHHEGALMAVVANGSHFTGDVLPAIGYQPSRELTNPDDRRTAGLPRRVTYPVPDDIEADEIEGRGATFEAVVGTAAGQVAVAPGVLRRSWMEGGRHYFEYASDVPIAGQLMFFSADYAVRREQWNGVEISIFHAPAHGDVIDRMMRSARASLKYFSAQFGAYPYPFLQVVEQPGLALGMGVDGSGVVTGREGFFLLDPREGGLDVVSEVVGHEVAHQWWGMQLSPEPAEGAIILSEGLAWYSAMQVVKHELGEDELRRFRAFMREPYPWPPIRTGRPLLRAMDPWAGYRKAPYAFFTLSEYIGEERVNRALRALLEAHRGVGARRATTLDLYRELRAVTPDSLQSLLHDLFAANSFWHLTAERATARQLPSGEWSVTLEVGARKTVADTTGAETEVPMDEWIEVAVQGRRAPGARSAPVLYRERHRIRSGRHAITVTVPERPWRAGIDPDIVLLDLEPRDNVVEVTVAG